MIILNKHDTIECISLKDAVECMETVFVANFQHRCVVPQRHIINTQDGATLFMPSWIKSSSSSSSPSSSSSLPSSSSSLPSSSSSPTLSSSSSSLIKEKKQETFNDIGMLGVKVVSVRTENKKEGLPTIPGCILLMDEKTGIPKALLNASELTGLRTAAGSAVATKYLSRKGSKSLTVFGAGTQAKYHILTICHVLPSIQKVFICNRTKKNAQELVLELLSPQCRKIYDSCPFIFTSSTLLPGNTKSMESSDEKHKIEIIVCEDHEMAVRQSDIICTTTNSSSPLFDGKWIKPGTHLNCVGSYKPSMQEVDSHTVKNSKCIGDIVEAIWEESGDFLIPEGEKLIDRGHIIAGLGEMICKSMTIRENDEEITLFKSVGVAMQDIAIAECILQNAQAHGKGQLLTL